MNRIARSTALLLCAAGIGVTGCQQPERKSIVNFGHLRHLTEGITLAGESVSIVHIYANYPDYAWVDAKESGP